MDIINKLNIYLNYIRVGQDQYGNSYYKSKSSNKRVVMYRGLAEPSKIPPRWHAWLHHLVDDDAEFKRYIWQKDHMPNLTGTSLARFPSRHIVSDIDNYTLSSYYQAWNPNSVETTKL